MAVSDTVAERLYLGDGSTSQYSYPFKIFEDTDLVVITRDDTGEETTLVINTDYTVAGAGLETGGTITLSENLPVDVYLSVSRNIAYTQNLNLVDNDPFSATVINDAFDRACMRDQQLRDEVSRALKYEITTPSEDILDAQSFLDEAEAYQNNASASASDAADSESAAEAARDEAYNARDETQAIKDSAESIVGSVDLPVIQPEDAGKVLTVNESETGYTLELPTGGTFDTPQLSGAAVGNEAETVEITIGNYDADATYEITSEGSVNQVGAVLYWTLPSVSVDTAKTIQVRAYKPGYTWSTIGQHTLTVVNVPIVSDDVFTSDLTLISGDYYTETGHQGTVESNWVKHNLQRLDIIPNEATIDPSSTTSSLVLSGVSLVDGDKIWTKDTGTNDVVERAIGSVAGGTTCTSIVPALTAVPEKVWKAAGVTVATATSGSENEILLPKTAVDSIDATTTASQLVVDSMIDSLFYTGDENNVVVCSGSGFTDEERNVTSISKSTTTVSQGQLDATNAGQLTDISTDGKSFTVPSAYTAGRSIDPLSGKVYWEVTQTSGANYAVGGICKAAFDCATGNIGFPDYSTDTNSCWFPFGHMYGFSGTGTNLGLTYGNSTTQMIAVDTVAGKIWVGVGGVWYNAVDPSSGSGQVDTFAEQVWALYGGHSAVGQIRLTSSECLYSPPAGFDYLGDGTDMYTYTLGLNSALPDVPTAVAKKSATFVSDSVATLTWDTDHIVVVTAERTPAISYRSISAKVTSTIEPSNFQLAMWKGGA